MSETEQKACPRCNTKPLNYVSTELNDQKLYVDVYKCNCGYTSVTKPHIEAGGGVVFTD
jgi:hypothetical protein